MSESIPATVAHIKNRGDWFSFKYQEFETRNPATGISTKRWTK